MKLSELLRSVGVLCFDDTEIKGISDDSRLIEKDWLFIGIHGEYISEVLEKAFVLSEEKSYHVNMYECNQLKDKINIILNVFYNHPCSSLFVTGVCGTNGKTTVSYLISQLLEKNNEKVMLIGTSGIYYEDKQIETYNTTPSAFVLAYYFHLAITYGIKYIVMEVSSHAIAQDRITFIRFDRLVYTNISMDHLDYHLTFPVYEYTKFKLKNYLKKNGKVIVNADCVYFHDLYKTEISIITYGQYASHFMIHDIILNDKESMFSINGIKFHVNLLALFNVYNCVSSIVCLISMKICLNKLVEMCKTIRGMEGRLQVIEGKRTVWIDYAHTPDAIYELLSFANMVKRGKIILVMGCGGDRDKSKRSLMGKYAYDMSDFPIFTSDNPRNENVEDIVKDMMKNIEGDVLFIQSRKEAIKQAIQSSQKSDIIIVAGRGNEKFQKIKNKMIACKDETMILEILQMEDFNDV